VAAVRPAHPRSRVRRGRRAACALLIAASAPLCAPGLVPSAAGQGEPPATTAPPAATTPPPAGGAPVQQAAVALKLAVGDTGPDVERLQDALLARGEALTVDGEFGPMTKAAVERAQRQLGLPVTGIADQATLDALGIKLSPPMVCTPAETPSGKTGKYLKVFPVTGDDYNYSNDFGAPRHQGSHEGVDILSPRGTPIVAVADGFIKRMTRDETGLGGIWIWLQDNDGNTYYYAHLDTILKGIEASTRVTAGQQIATNGNTGDARFGAAHLHFEIHPKGGAAISPYADLRAVDPKVKGGDPVQPATCVPATPEPPTTPEPPPPPPETTPTAPATPAEEEPEQEKPVRRDTSKEPKPGRNALAGVELTVAQLRINQRISQAALRRINEVRVRLGGPRTTIKERPRGVVRLTVQQMLINQRISQAALRRVRELEALFSEEQLVPLSARDPDDISRAPADVKLSADQMLINQRIAQAAVRRINALLDRLPKPRRGTKTVE
jgi:murein DD-endopeptidase MepM/ murein hydrolase activator NlpD